MKQKTMSKIKEFMRLNPLLSYKSDIEIIYFIEKRDSVQNKCKHMKSVYTENASCVLCGKQLLGVKKWQLY
jgi:hypothetical protein